MEPETLELIIGGCVTTCLAIGAAEITARLLDRYTRWKRLEKAQPPRRLLERMKEEPKKDGQPQNFGLILSGNSEDRHIRSCEEGYATFLGLGFEPENLYVLDGYGEERKGYPIDGPATKETLQKVFGHLKRRIDKEDSFFLYVSDHGGSKRGLWKRLTGKMGRGFIHLVGDLEYVDELEQKLEDLDATKGLLFFTQCMGGNFAKGLDLREYTRIAVSAPDKPAYDQYFARNFFQAFWRRAADRNHDNNISYKEAFEYAMRHDIGCLYDQNMPNIHGRTDTYFKIISQKGKQ